MTHETEGPKAKKLSGESRNKVRYSFASRERNLDHTAAKPSPLPIFTATSTLDPTRQNKPSFPFSGSYLYQKW